MDKESPMNRKKLFLILQSLLCILLAVLLASAVIFIYREGAALKGEDPLAWIFTREKIGAYLRTIRPLFYITVVFAVIGLILGVKDERGLKPVKGGKVENPAPPAREKTIRTILLVAALCLIAAGVLNGSARDVFAKAVKICSECIGLG